MPLLLFVAGHEVFQILFKLINNCYAVTHFYLILFETNVAELLFKTYTVSNSRINSTF